MDTQSETQIHQSVMKYIRMHPHLEKYVIHIPNQGKRSYKTANLFKSMGMKAGIPDLFIAYPSRGYHGAWIELKSQKGKLSEHQRDFLELMKSQNYFTSVCYSFDEAIEAILTYLAS